MDTTDDLENGSALSRSKTMPSLGRAMNNSDLLAKARDKAEKAIRLKKIFTIKGGYSAVRQGLRKRGWIEKVYSIPGPQKQTHRRCTSGGDGGNDDDDDDDTDSDNDQPKGAQWEEEDGLYRFMARIVRNVNPTFTWTSFKREVNFRLLTKEQMVNHYRKAGSFTTKAGLCVNMRQVPWFDESDPDEFYPRCYKLRNEEEKEEFVDDFRLTSCINILKAVTNMYMEGGECNEERRDKETIVETSSVQFECTNHECTSSRPNQSTGNLCVHVLQTKAEQEGKEKVFLASDSGIQKKRNRIIVPQDCLDRAIIQCQKYLAFRSHDDIDQPTERDFLTPAQWDEIINWYYQLVHEGGIIPNVPARILSQIEEMLERIKALRPQFELDGVKNMWIVKPGAKSRGRGVICYDRLEDMLKLVSSQIVKYVVQKYIERPLLIHNCKFDIRQWFLVTDWNPLTIYFYMDSYLRFCSQEFTLDDYDEAIHLSNYSIQKHYKNGPRSKELPEENVWTHEQFKDYIKSQKLPNHWDDIIYPGMKKAIICALLSSQHSVEYRKSSFALYGADFMLTEDYRVWLIEINASPSMERSTEITSRLCNSVLEDTLKVVLDRKKDRSCDIGRFELAYTHPLVTIPPYTPYIRKTWAVNGVQIRKPCVLDVKKNPHPENVFPPRKEKHVISNDKLTDNSVETVSKNTGNNRRPLIESNQEENPNPKPSNSAPVKKSVAKEATDSSHVQVKTRAVVHKSSNIVNNISIIQSNNNTSVTADKLNSDSTSIHSHQHSENGRQSQHSRYSARARTETGTYVDEGQSDYGGNRSSLLLVPKMSTVVSGDIPPSYASNLSTRETVSKTSVSTNFTIPSIDDRDRHALSANNVETTGLRTLKAQAKGQSNLPAAGATTTP